MFRLIFTFMSRVNLFYLFHFEAFSMAFTYNNVEMLTGESNVCHKTYHISYEYVLHLLNTT